LGWEADPTRVADFVRRLERGLPAEDEFSVLCGWLGKCQLLHKLDQQQIPASFRRQFQVPDLLAMFSTQTNDRPVLIEVKSKKVNVLSFKADYLNRLNNYARLVQMPLLIAWKFHGVWTLFEAKHLERAKTNFNISRETALKESILCALAGDVAYKIGKGAGVHFRMRKKDFISVSDHDGVRNERWNMVIEEVSFTDHEGLHRSDLSGDVQSLFTTWDLQEQQDHQEPYIWIRFVAGDEGMQFAHTALVRLLQWESPSDGRPDWRSLLFKEQVTRNIANFSAALDKALEQNVVYYIFRVRPHTQPDFLASLVLA